MKQGCLFESETFSTLSGTRETKVLIGLIRPGGMTQIQSFARRSGLMRLRGDLHKVDLVIAQMTLEQLGKLGARAHTGFVCWLVGWLCESTPCIPTWM